MWSQVDLEVRRYAHLSADHLASYAERLGELREWGLSIHGTNPSQVKKNMGLDCFSALIFLAPRPGLEPGTHGLTGEFELVRSQLSQRLAALANPQNSLSAAQLWHSVHQL